MCKRNDNWLGMNWIRQSKRLAIYLRDGLACCYCGASVEDGVKLTLDHLKPHSKGGSNAETNLVTCCLKCNSSRGNRSVAKFAAAVAEYANHGLTADAIRAHLTACRTRPLGQFKTEANALIARRGSALKAINNPQ